MHRTTLDLPPSTRGLHDITTLVEQVVEQAGVAEGLCHLFLLHTSASLVIQENADPDVLVDLESWMARVVPDGNPAYRHTCEGSDDMPAHIRAALTATSLTVPVALGRLLLGAWQGIYLYEHRLQTHRRRVVVTIQG